jgi:hypothetical protein
VTSPTTATAAAATTTTQLQHHVITKTCSGGTVIETTTNPSPPVAANPTQFVGTTSFDKTLIASEKSAGPVPVDVSEKMAAAETGFPITSFSSYGLTASTLQPFQTLIPSIPTAAKPAFDLEACLLTPSKSPSVHCDSASTDEPPSDSATASG